MTEQRPPYAAKKYINSSMNKAGPDYGGFIVPETYVIYKEGWIWKVVRGIGMWLFMLGTKTTYPIRAIIDHFERVGKG